MSLENASQRQDSYQKPGVQHASAPAEYVIDAALRIVVVKFRKNLLFADIQRYAARLRADPEFDPSFGEIADLRGVEGVDVQADEFVRLADEIDPFAPTARRAFVARTSVQKHAARMHKILRTSRNFEIFDSIEQAKLWIRS